MCKSVNDIPKFNNCIGNLEIDMKWKNRSLLHLLILRKILQNVQHLVRNIVHDPPWLICKSSYNRDQAMKIFIREYWTTLKVQSCKLYNNKYMISSTQITNTEIFAFVSDLVFKLLSRKALYVNAKDNRNC